jgi:hypothetical protein
MQQNEVLRSELLGRNLVLGGCDTIKGGGMT